MNIQDQLVNDIELIPSSAPIAQIQKLFNELPYSHLPVFEHGIYQGCLSGNDVASFELEKSIEEYRFALEDFFIRDTNNWMEALNAFSLHESNFLPVLNKQNQYLGYVELESMLHHLTDSPFLADAGNIITLEKPYKDYSFSEICQIVETNGSQVLGCFLSGLENDLATITVKVSATGFNALLQSFRRYGYRIVSQHQEDSFQTNLEERKDYLEKYLNI